MKKVALIGFGTIGQYVFQQLTTRNDIQVACIFETNPAAMQKIPDGLATDCPETFEARLAEAGVELVVEMATQLAVRELAPRILPHSDMIVFSTTAFSDREFEVQALDLCHRYSRKLYIPHGAILGLDGIFDGRDKLESVTITTTKKPLNLGLDAASKRTVLFEGPTRDACKLYPRNVNVHAGIAIAGLGFDKTLSKIVADPDSEGNSHLIEVTADGVRFRIEVLSLPVGLVSGAYTPISAYSAVCKIFGNSGYAII